MEGLDLESLEEIMRVNTRTNILARKKAEE